MVQERQDPESVTFADGFCNNFNGITGWERNVSGIYTIISVITYFEKSTDNFRGFVVTENFSPVLT